jgi:hypothetical protein
MKTKEFWSEVSAQCEEHQADNILVYMRLMLQKAEAAEVQVRRDDFGAYGKGLELFPGVFDSRDDNWFVRINEYAKGLGVKLDHYIVSSGIKEMVEGTPLSRYFKAIYASSFLYDHHGIARWPALALNYTTKTQYLFRINKGSLDVYDHSIINTYVPKADRAVPFENMIYIGDGETDIPCFRLVKDQGGHSIAVYENTKRGAKKKAQTIIEDGRVNFAAPADFSDGQLVDRIVKSVIGKIASDTNLRSLGRL